MAQRTKSTTAEDVRSVIGHKRVSYPEIIERLEARGLPTRGVGVVCRGEGFRATWANGEPYSWLHVYLDEDEHPGGPLYVEADSGS